MGFNATAYAGKQASRGRDGEFLAGLKNGTIVIKNVEVFKGQKDPVIFQVTGVVKAGNKNTDPGALGEKGVQAEVGDTVITQQQSLKQGADGRIIAELEAILGPDLPPEGTEANNAAREAAFKDLLRLDANGYTKQGTQCPARGYELKFTSDESSTKKGFYPVNYSHVAMTELQAAANAKEYLGDE